MNARACKYKNNAKSAFTFVFDDGCYLESTLLVYDAFKDIYEKTGIKFKATSAQTVNFISPTLKELWDRLFKEGYFDICAHSLDHCVGYNKNTEPSVLHNDACKTKECLEKMYPNMPVNIFVTPGGGSDSVGWDILSKYYIANRNGNDRLNIPGSINWYDIGTFTAMLKRPSKDYIDSIDNTIENGGWSVQINHWITKKEEDVFHSQAYNTFLDQCNYLATKAKEKDIWVCSLNEATLYLQEVEKAIVSIEEGDNGVVVSLKTPLNKEIYNYPLTIEIDTNKALIDSNGKELLPQNGKIYIDLLPEESATFTIL